LNSKYLIMSTVAEENYLKAIFKLSEELEKEVPTSFLADQLATKASSVTDMVQKLADKNLVNYVKYQGVTLTPEGERIAIQLIRRHRLWELFLFQNLGFQWDEIHEIAEQLEHIKSDLLIDRLDQFLNFPLKDPHGDPIPDQEGNFPEVNSTPLSQLKMGTKGIVVGVNDKSSTFLIYLVKIGIQLGTEIEVLEWHDFDHSVDIKINDLKLIHLSYQSAQNILMANK